MRKKVCTRPQCGKEYFEGEGYDDLTVCSICGAALDEILVEDSEVVEADSEEFDEVIDGEYEEIDEDYNENLEEDVLASGESYVEEEEEEEGSDADRTDEDDAKDEDVSQESTESNVLDEELERKCESNKDEISSKEDEVKDDTGDEEETVPVNVEENPLKEAVPMDIENTEKEDYNDKANEEEDKEDETVEKEDDEEDSDNDDEIKGNNLILYKGNEIYKVYELKYDETVVGRESSEFTPDIDLHELDVNNATSRKHLLVYREDGNYYARNISRKCSVHIKKADQPQAKPLLFGDSCILEDGDFIVLSGKFIIEAYLEDTSEE